MTEDGHAKYWKASSFAYAGDDRDFPCDKFFLEEVKQFCIKELSLAVSAELEEVEKEVEVMKKIVKELFPDATLNSLDEDTAFQVEHKNGYNKALYCVLDIISKHKKL